MKKKILIILILIVTSLMVINVVDDNKNTVKVVSYNGNNLKISIDGNSSNTLPTSGIYYLVDYECENSATKIEWDKDNYKLNVSNRTKKGGVSCYLNFKSKPLLSEMPVGSYVKYTGDNGCDNTNVVNGYSSCMGKNSKYSSDNDMGYCFISDYKFYVNGWRIGYVKDGSAYLISAGAPECICTGLDGTVSSSNCSSGLATEDLSKHYDNMDAIALKYCNKDMAKGGVCDNSTSWAMNSADFEAILGVPLSTKSCYAKASNLSCGYANDLIDNGGYYWNKAAYSSTSDQFFYWNPAYRYATNRNSQYVIGVRPVLALDYSVVVISGDGTYESPYIIDSSFFEINDGAKYINSSDNLSAVNLSISTSQADVSSMCISVDTSECTNYVDFNNSYTIDLSDEIDGEKIIYVYLKNASLDIVSVMSRSIIIDRVPPTNSIISISDGTTPNRILTLSSTDATDMCISNTLVDVNSCTGWVDYSTSKIWKLTSSFGDKTVYVYFKDEAGNISMVNASANVSDYSYFIDGYNPGKLYLMRSDGATALVDVTVDSFNWYTVDSLDVNVCTTDNSSSANTYIWCITNDNKIYYKSSYLGTSWTEWTKVSNLIDVSKYSYSIYSSTSNLFMVRSDGRIRYISNSSSPLADWNWGHDHEMALCTGFGLSYVSCIGHNNSYYFLTSPSRYYNYTGPVFEFVPPISSRNTWIDSKTNIVNTITVWDEDNSIINYYFNHQDSSTVQIFNSDIPGGGVKTAATTGGNAIYNIVLAEDGYLYYKNYGDVSWIKTGLQVS